jgi:hypothetical protein
MMRNRLVLTAALVAVLTCIMGASITLDTLTPNPNAFPQTNYFYCLIHPLGLTRSGAKRLRFFQW